MNRDKQRLSAKLIVKLMDFLSVELWEPTGVKDPNAPILAEIEKLKAKNIEFETFKVNSEKFQKETVEKYESAIKSKDKTIKELKQKLDKLKAGING